MTSSAVAPSTVIVAITILAILVVFYCHAVRRRHGLLGLVVLWIWATEYSLRPIGVLVAGEFGREGGYLRYLDDIRSDAILDANLVALLGTVALTVGLAVGLRAAPRRSSHSVVHAARGFRIPTLPVVGATLVVSVAVALQMGTVGGALFGQPGRQNVTSGYLYLLVNIGGLTILVVTVAAREALLRTRSVQRLLIVSYVAFVALHVVVLGGRSEVIIVTIALLSVVTVRFQRPRQTVLVLGLVVATVALGVQRVATREALTAGNAGRSRVDLIGESLRDPLKLITRYDVTAYDKLILLEDSDPDPSFGVTYIASLVAPIPGAPVSGLQGGNRVFTKLYIPARYQRNVTFEGISMLGEARYSFGLVGPPVVAFGVGFLLAAVARRGQTSPRWQLTSALAIGIFPTLVRADALNTAAIGGSLVIFAHLLLSGFTRSAPRRRVRASVERRPSRAPDLAAPRL